MQRLQDANDGAQQLSIFCAFLYLSCLRIPRLECADFGAGRGATVCTV